MEFSETRRRVKLRERHLKCLRLHFAAAPSKFKVGRHQHAWEVRGPRLLFAFGKGSKVTNIWHHHPNLIWYHDIIVYHMICVLQQSSHKTSFNTSFFNTSMTIKIWSGSAARPRLPRQVRAATPRIPRTGPCHFGREGLQWSPPRVVSDCYVLDISWHDKTANKNLGKH